MEVSDNGGTPKYPKMDGLERTEHPINMDDLRVWTIHVEPILFDITLWLCQQFAIEAMAIEIVDYVDFPLNNCGSFHSDVNVYQRVAMNCDFMDSQVGFCGLIAPDTELWSSFYRVW